jgi:hypothetical protein
MDALRILIWQQINNHIRSTSKPKILTMTYYLRPILLFADTDISIMKMCLDTSILAKSGSEGVQTLGFQIEHEYKYSNQPKNCSTYY